MTLSSDDGKLYYQLWLPLLDYVNQKYGVNKKVNNMAGAKRLEPAEVKEISDRLVDDLSVIDEYLMNNQQLPEENRKIIEGWKKVSEEDLLLNGILKVVQ